MTTGPRRLFLGFWLAALAFVAPASAEAEPLAITNVTVLTMADDRALAGQTVVVEGERIVAMGPTAAMALPTSGRIIDGSGKVLIPGLAEMHGHIPSPATDTQEIADILFLYVANGVTTVRGMLGHLGQLQLREQANSGEVVSPTLYLAGPSFNGNSVSSPEQARAMVRAQVDAGWNLLKIHPGLTRAEFDAVAETANALGIRFAGHVPEDVGLAQALAQSQETFDHIDGYIAYLGGEAEPVPQVELDAVADLTREAGAWIVPTHALWEILYGVPQLEALLAYDELKYMPKRVVTGWKNRFRPRRTNGAPTHGVRIENRDRLLKTLNDRGVPILFGTDSPQLFSVPGFSVRREIAAMREAGLGPYDILKSATANVGHYFANEDDFGMIAPGKRADLVLLNGNPLEDLSVLDTPAAVILRGRVFDRAAIDAGLSEISARYAD
ncbi:MAG: amidohydrolase family protein [Sphingomonadales bacterium]|nr:amidohydrolase family protein [Sphingomonadales bacterium]